MRSRPRSSTVARSVATILLVLASLIATADARAQVFELQGGGSSFNQGYGGALNVWGDRFEGNVGLGYLDGMRFSVFFKHLVGRDTLRLGNDAIPVRFATDVFGSSNTILAQGAGIRRATRRSMVYAFAGASAVATPAPFVNAMNHDRFIGVLQAERLLSPSIRATTHALFASRQTILQGLHWESPNGYEAGLTGGIGGNQPYGSISAAVKHQKVDIRASLVGMGERFRRTGVPTPAQSEADRENVLITWRPLDGFSLGAGRQHFRQDSTLPGIPDRATLNQVFGSARLLGMNLAAGVFDSRTGHVQSLSSYFSASRDVTRWLQTDLYLLRVWSPEPSRSSTPIVRLREFLSPRFSVLQVITRANGRTTASFGGSMTSGLTSFGLDYQVMHTPYRPTEPFVQTIALNVRIPLGKYRVNAASFVSPDGHVSYTGSASTFFYAGDVLTGPARAVEIKFERYIVQGTVVDDAGTPVDGAAVEIGGAPVFTDSRGRFFHRLSSSKVVPIRVLLEDFLATGQYAVMEAPASAVPRHERDSTPIRIVVRRVPQARVEAASGAPVRPSPND
jgi:hypothetical protein